MKQFEEWEGFKGRIWKEEINTRDFIQENYTPMMETKASLQDLQKQQNKLWVSLQGLQKEEQKKRWKFVDMDTDIVSSLTSHGPGISVKKQKIWSRSLVFRQTNH